MGGIGQHAIIRLHIRFDILDKVVGKLVHLPLERRVAARSKTEGAGVSRRLRRDEIEDRLDDIARRRGADELNSLRDEARRIAPLIGREVELAELDRLIGALQGTRDAPLTTDRAKARSAGAPYDPERLELFELLYAELRRTAPVIRSAPARTSETQRTLAFFDAYFSNFIEGTEFTS